MDATEAARQRLATLGAPMLGLVLIEFLLGMSLNLFGPLPTGSPLAVLEASPLLIVHLAVGVLVLGISARAAALAIRGRAGRLRAVTIGGLLSGVAAFAAGWVFAFGSQDPVASYVMSLGFVGVLIAAAVLLWYRGSVPVPTPAAATVVAPPRME